MGILVYSLLIINFIAALIYYFKVKCEIPLLLAAFNWLVVYRIFSLKSGYGTWVQFDYGIAFTFTMNMAYKVNALILSGTTVLIYSFMLFYRPPNKINADNNNLLREFILKSRVSIIACLIFFTIFEVVLAGNISAGYGLLSTLGNSSFIILFFLVIVFTESKKSFVKTLFFIFFIILGYLNYNPGLRFQFLGWLIPVGYFLTRKLMPLSKLTCFALGLAFVLIMFSVAGVLRYTTTDEISNSEIVSAGAERLISADDINLIDGFIMMYEVYPKYLNFTYGMQHLEIFLRPVPRTLWPNKPLAGWFQNYEAKYNLPQVTIGFSPTIYGVFYSEMGKLGVVIFSVFWAFLFSFLYRSFSAFNSDLWAIHVGILIACMIPILRSGDLPGDFAIVLMSYWPMAVFVWQYKKFCRKKMMNVRY